MEFNGLCVCPCLWVSVCGGEKVDEGNVKATFGGCVRSGGGASDA